MMLFRDIQMENDSSGAIKRHSGSNNSPTAHINDTSMQSTNYINNAADEIKEIEKVPSIIALKKVIPAHCFKSCMATSFYYVIKDVAIIFMLYSIGAILERNAPYLYLLYLGPYWVVQGTMFWALFVLGHDCGHSSFSKSTVINDIIGNTLHAVILVPYYPWVLTHRHHHKNTGNIDKDEIFYPLREKYKNNDIKVIKPLPLFGISWWLYLFKGYNPRPVCHFNPFDPMLIKHSTQCFISLGSICIWLWFLGLYYHTYGLFSLVCYYAIPHFVFMSWLVMVTFLHHHDVGVKWYADDIWNNVIGQLSSVDRDYGWAHELTHNIGTHQIHHLFTKIPHYHLEEATAAFRVAFPPLVCKSNEPILKSYWNMFEKWCDQRHIKNDTKIHIYK